MFEDEVQVWRALCLGGEVGILHGKGYGRDGWVKGWGVEYRGVECVG